MFPIFSSCLYVLCFWLMIWIILWSSSSPSLAGGGGGGAKNVNRNITKLLERYPNLSSFNAYLSTTHLADSINSNNGNITLLAMDDPVMCHLLDSIKLNETLIERVLSMHVVLGYYDLQRLQTLPDNTAFLTLGNTTIHQEHGNNSDDSMTTMVTKLNNNDGGTVTFAFAVGPSGPETGVVTAKLVRAIASVPRYISVLQISHVQVPHGIESYPTLFTSAKSGSKKSKALPVDTIFKLPSPLPAWPAGKRFASGSIDLGGLVVQQISAFTKVWEIYEKGPDNLGATFFEPSVLPEGYFMLGSYAQPNNRPFYGWVLVGKDTTNDHTNGSLKSPIDYILIWSSETSKINANGVGYIWQPVPPHGYKAVGHVVTTCSQKPSLEKVRCVRSDLTEHCEADTSIWGIDKGSNRISIFNLRPSKRGIKAHGVGIGSFIATKGKNLSALACLKNAKNNMSSSMPSKSQIDALVQLYAPRVYFHPDETFLPSSVSWFFTNGALLYKKGEESKPVAIEPTGSNLPRGGSDDDAYWLDLPVNSASKERLKKGYLQSSQAYIHVKPMLGATFTDIVIWLFYPFNGPMKVKVIFFNLTLGRLGEHVGDWEHVTLRISNFNGQLQSVYFSQHSAGVWVSASMLEYIDGNRFVAYASLHGHAANYKPGSFLQGKLGIGVRNDFGRSNMFMDTGANFTVIAAGYLGSAITAPPWLNYRREWGPRIDSDIAMDLVLVGKILPGKLQKVFQNAMCIPDETLKGEGPTGPTVKSSWNGDEIED